MVSIRQISHTDLEETLRLHNQFTAQDRSLQTFESHYRETPSLFIGAYETDSLLGICLGWPASEKRARLVGIGVTPGRRQSGIGTRLISTFEENAAAIGIESISVASAGGYVDHFYAGMGFTPTRILVRGDPAEFPSEYRDLGFDIVDEQWEEGTFKLYIEVDELDHEMLSSVRETFGDDDAIYIMEKSLGGDR